MEYETMDYETVDWESEALRIVAAFEVTEECVSLEGPEGMCLKTLDSQPTNLLCADGCLLIVKYNEFGRDFIQLRPEFQTAGKAADRDNFDLLRVEWNGKIASSYGLRHSLKFARILFHLNWLTPEAETELEVCISAHEQLE